MIRGEQASAEIAGTTPGRAVVTDRLEGGIPA